MNIVHLFAPVWLQGIEELYVTGAPNEDIVQNHLT